jgi:hypothetical protein
MVDKSIFEVYLDPKTMREKELSSTTPRDMHSKAYNEK